MCVSVGEWERRVRGCVPQLTPTRQLSTRTSRPETRSTSACWQSTSGRRSDWLGLVDMSTSTVDQWYKTLYHCYMCSTTKSNLQYRMQYRIWCRMRCHKFLLRHRKKKFCSSTRLFCGSTRLFCGSTRLFCSSVRVFMQYHISFHIAPLTFLCGVTYLYCSVASRILMQHHMRYWEMWYHLRYTF